MPKSNSSPNFDPTAVFGAFKLPHVDVDALVAAQRRNVEAVTAATTVAADGYKALAARQAEIMRGVVDEYVSTVRDLMAAKDPKLGTAKQVEFAKSAFENSVTQARELTDIATKANVEAFEVLNKRVAEGFDEIQALTRKV